MPRQRSHRPVALVTGGARNIGRALALALADDGYDVAIVTRKSAHAAGYVVKAIQKAGRNALAFRSDLTQAGEPKRIITEVHRSLGRLDVLINNIGDYWRGELRKLTPKTLRAMVASNLLVASECCLAAWPIMKKRGSGRIINLGYVFADRLAANPKVAAYNAAKTALLSFSLSLAKEMISDGITLNTISPGHHESTVDQSEATLKKIPADRLANDRDLIAAMRYLLSPDAAYVTGTNIKVSGGYGI